ncbi:hypothetical protein J4212_01615 [Candidatus Woesearchaeota archaeon]|nr:hypothetical protein [Candidatus Woesearchaeota archaeon]
MPSKFQIISVFLLVLSSFILSSCSAESEKQKEYSKCTSVCSSVLGNDYVTLDLCRKECRIKFLEES